MTAVKMDRGRIIVGVIIAFLAVLSIFIYLSKSEVTGDITGKAIVKQDDANAINDASATEQEQQKECSSGCNPDNIVQYCSNGKWNECSSEKVCSLGKCVTPEKTRKATISSSAGEGSGGVGSNIATASAGNIYELGEINTEKSIELIKNDAAKFTLSNEEYSLILQDNTASDVTISIDSQTFNIKVGDSQQIDLNSDDSFDINVKLKSINIISNKATLVLRI